MTFGTPNDERPGQRGLGEGESSSIDKINNEKKHPHLPTFPALPTELWESKIDTMSLPPPGFFSAPRFRPVADVQCKRGPAAMEADNRARCPDILTFGFLLFRFCPLQKKVETKRHARGERQAQMISKHRIIEETNCGELIVRQCTTT